MGALVSRMLKSRLLTTQLSTAFQKDQGRGKRQVGRQQKAKRRRKRLGTPKVAWDPWSISSPVQGGMQGAQHMWKWKDRVYIKRPAQGHHRAAVARSRTQTGSLAPQPAELAPLEEPECKWQCWQERAPRPCTPFHPLLTYPHSFFPLNNSGSSKTHVETIIFTAIDKATEMRKVSDLSILPQTSWETHGLLHAVSSWCTGCPVMRWSLHEDADVAGSRFRLAVGHGIRTRDSLEVKIKAGVRV